MPAVGVFVDSVATESGAGVLLPVCAYFSRAVCAFLQKLQLSSSPISTNTLLSPA